MEKRLTWKQSVDGHEDVGLRPGVTVGEAICKLADLEERKTIPLDEVYRVIAGHSNYHGDNILSALTCIAEGKEVKSVRPLPAGTAQEQNHDCHWATEQAYKNGYKDGLPKWIPVTERFPQKKGEVCKNVILLMDDGLVTAGWLNEDTGKAYYLDTRNDFISKVPISRATHWKEIK